MDANLEYVDLEDAHSDVDQEDADLDMDLEDPNLEDAQPSLYDWRIIQIANPCLFWHSAIITHGIHFRLVE